MKTYTFTTPLQIATGLSTSLTIKSVQVTAMNYNQTPNLAQLGTGLLDITLTDPDTGWQETISYRDASVLTFWQSAVTPVQGDTFEDLAAIALFDKLVADNKLPAGTVS
jgi:hypothetical protein